MSDSPDPPRKHFQLKPREFDKVNASPRAPGEDDASLAAPDPGPSELDGGRIDVKDLFKQANRPGRALSKRARPTGENDVQELMRANATHADAAGLNQVPLQKRRASRRKRDYFLLLIPVDAFFLSLVFFGGNVMTFAYGVAGIILFTLGLTWVMWFVMDDY